MSAQVVWMVGWAERRITSPVLRSFVIGKWTRNLRRWQSVLKVYNLQRSGSPIEEETLTNLCNPNPADQVTPGTWLRRCGGPTHFSILSSAERNKR